MSEQVYAITDSQDGNPINGFANHDERPHHFKCEFDSDSDEYSDVYRLVPISSATLERVMEIQKIWLRWRAAYDANETTLDTHPALPDERQRYEKLKEAVDRAINDVQQMPIRAHARFRQDGTVEWDRVAP